MKIFRIKMQERNKIMLFGPRIFVLCLLSFGLLFAPDIFAPNRYSHLGSAENPKAPRSKLRAACWKAALATGHARKIKSQGFGLRRNGFYKYFQAPDCWRRGY